jgi:hypothetical protein
MKSMTLGAKRPHKIKACIIHDNCKLIMSGVKKPSASFIKLMD